MATSKATIDYLLDQLSGANQVSAKKMFGEYSLYVAGKPIALVCDDQLFLKPIQAARDLIPVVVERSPFPGAKLHILVTADLWEDGEWLSRLAEAMANALPAPKPKKKAPASRRQS